MCSKSKAAASDPCCAGVSSLLSIGFKLGSKAAQARIQLHGELIILYKVPRRTQSVQLLHILQGALQMPPLATRKLPNMPRKSVRAKLPGGSLVRRLLKVGLQRHAELAVKIIQVLLDSLPLLTDEAKTAYRAPEVVECRVGGEVND